MADARGRDGRVAGTPSVVAMPGRPPVIINVNGKTVTINGDDATIARSEASGTPDFRILEVGWCMFSPMSFQARATNRSRLWARTANPVQIVAHVCPLRRSQSH